MNALLNKQEDHRRALAAAAEAITERKKGEKFVVSKALKETPPGPSIAAGGNQTAAMENHLQTEEGGTQGMDTRTRPTSRSPRLGGTPSIAALH